MRKYLYILLCLAIGIIENAKATDIGVYYYPGWNKPEFDAWKRIRNYPDRKPLLGWYKEGDDSVIVQQLQWMQDYGINYIAYDWYWDKFSETKTRTYAIDAYLRNSKNYNVKFSLLWANHTGTPYSLNDFDRIVDYWVLKYFNNEKYLKIDGKPVVFIFSSALFEKNANSFGETTKSLISRANNKLIKKGLPGIYFVASTSGNNLQLGKPLMDDGYSALSAYNYHTGVDERTNRIKKSSESYEELTSGYIHNWKAVLNSTSLPYIIPVTSGWNKKPWGGSNNPKHDNSYSNPQQFRYQLEMAKQFLKKYPEKTLNNIIICCWNEYGEGSYIEPSQEYKYEYLQQIKSVFKDNTNNQ